MPTIILSGNPQEVARFLTALDPVNSSTFYPHKCADPDHYEDVTVTYTAVPGRDPEITAVAKSNIRSSLVQTGYVVVNQ